MVKPYMYYNYVNVYYYYKEYYIELVEFILSFDVKTDYITQAIKGHTLCVQIWHKGRPALIAVVLSDYYHVWWQGGQQHSYYRMYGSVCARERYFWMLHREVRAANKIKEARRMKIALLAVVGSSVYGVLRNLFSQNSLSMKSYLELVNALS